MSYAFLAWLFAYSSFAYADDVKEGLVKAAFVYNFTKLIEWPDNNSSISICIDESVSYPNAIKKIEERSNSRRQYKVQTNPSSHSGCSVYVSSGKYRKQAPPTLTIGEGEAFVNKGGMIAFVKAGDKVKFIINLKKLKAAGLKLNPQLLEVAHKVIRK